MLKVVDHVRFTWLAENPIGETHGSTAGSIPIFMRYLSDKGFLNDKRNIVALNPTIALSIRYNNILIAFENMTLSKNMRLQPRVAKLILHELGDAFFAY